MSYVYTPGMADVKTPSIVHLGHVRPKTNDLAILYWQPNLQHGLINTTPREDFVILMPWLCVTLIHCKLQNCNDII
jgi:hypothetical protein